MTDILKRVPLLGVSLILIGAAMLLHRLHVVSIHWQTLVWAIIALFGLYRALDGFAVNMRGRIFWGSLIFFVGLYNVLRWLDVVYLDRSYLFPLFVAAVGGSFLITYLSSPREWHILVPSVFFLGLGGLMIGTEMGYLYRWDVIPLVNTYWPVALIVFGVSLLSRHRSA